MIKIKQLLSTNKHILFFISLLRIILYYIYDIKRFIRFATLGGNPRSKGQYEGILTKDYHKIEKSISHAKFRPYAGKQVIYGIFAMIPKFHYSFGKSSVETIALNTIEQYIIMHKDKNLHNDYISDIEKKLKKTRNIIQVDNNIDTGGAKIIHKEDIISQSNINLHPFFYSRYSIRDFSPKDVNINKIYQAIDLAKKTPSVCNRQGWKVYLLTNKNDIQKALTIQGGSRGFEDKVNKVAIICADINIFHEPKERNQQWVDGGLFSMTFVYALHSLGLATCCLNWSAKPKKDKLLRMSFPQICPQNSIIMMVAIGHYPDEIKVCQSPRKNSSELLEVLN